MDNVISSLVFVVILLHISQVGSKETRIETECFQTVLHYYSNPDVGGTSDLFLTYINDNFKTITVDLSCEGFANDSGVIHVEEVRLLLPATIKDYCLDHNITSHKDCVSSSQCDCCEIPENICKSSPRGGYSTCNGKKECGLQVTSEFLEEDCPGREYECASQKCHSRWAEVKYSCHKRRFPHWLIPLIAILPACVIVAVCLVCWFKCRECVASKDTEAGPVNENHGLISHKRGSSLEDPLMAREKPQA